MAGVVIGRFKSGRISVAVVEGDYEGKPTISFTINKSVFDKKTNQWKDSPFFTSTDIKDLAGILDKVIQHNVKYVKAGPKTGSPPKQNPPASNDPMDQGFPDGEDIPF